VLFDIDSALDPDTVFDRWCHFWGTLCPHKVLAPMQHSLTELALLSDTNFGAFSGLSFAGLQFPHLCALSLCRLVFEPSVGAQHFILRHTATLARLELFTCKLPISINIFLPPSPSTALAQDEESSSGPWEGIWDRFAAELTALVSLYVDECRVAWSSDFRYVLPDPETMTYKGIMAPARRDAADAAALRRFHMTVTARSEEAGQREAHREAPDAPVGKQWCHTQPGRTRCVSCLEA